MLQLLSFSLFLLLFRKIADVNSLDKKLSACFMKKTFDEKKRIDCTYSISGITIQFHENRSAEKICILYIFVYPYLELLPYYSFHPLLSYLPQ
jgi:hypothetical protein